MKHLFIALICTVIGFSASASDLTPKNELRKSIKVELEIKTNSKKSENGNFFRIQRAFTFHDSCGQAITVYVSAPHGTYWAEMGSTASHYVIDHLDSAGCYQP
ncbi:hypothetical protein [Pedobacter nototheniae]|uniref:hypothetical protein n=1 Tax=Pedobacter nototheniae TaxID=2488994 RepID=UPI0029312B22|nr:hypothetical protein [Pedobacter nototheniae]